MKIKLWMAQRLARKLSNHTRKERRSLRDFQRHELRRIRSEETRARGLRLFIAWSMRASEAHVPLAVQSWQPSIAGAA